LAFYCGIIAGSLLAGTLANFSGRKPTLILGQILQAFSSYLLIISNNFVPFLLNLIIAGMSFGITLIMANTLLSELMPQKYRGKSLLFISFIAVIGKFFAIMAAYFFGLQNWRIP
jgi:putative MFS transporter